MKYFALHGVVRPVHDEDENGAEKLKRIGFKPCNKNGLSAADRKKAKAAVGKEEKA